MRRSLVLAALALLTLAAAAMQATILPTGWHITPPPAAMALTGTMPQGIALSPDGTKLAIVESGVNPAALRIVRVPTLATISVIKLKDAFASPVWSGNTHVMVAGGSTNSVFDVAIDSGTIANAATGGNYIAAIAPMRNGPAFVNDSAGTVTVPQPRATPAVIKTGRNPAALAFAGSNDLYVANKGEATVTHVTFPSLKTQTISVDLHPSALALSTDHGRLFVACADADAIDVIDTKTDAVVQRINVGLPQGPGASPNAIAVASDGTLYVSLGAEDAVAQIKNGKVVARYPAGWYPTGLAVDAHNIYIVNGKGERSHANPQFLPTVRHAPGYVGEIMVGSVRLIPRNRFNAQSTAQVLANIPAPQATPPQTVVRPNGPIKHVIYIIKENRTYDQILGDVPGANGDPKLVYFGEKITPNQHAIVKRFGIFDNTYTDAQVSASGHNWSTAAFANDYLERFWPPVYGDRRDTYDFEDGAVASTPRNGYIWDDANAHNVSIRDYGEFTSDAVIGNGFATTSMPGLKGKIDEHYAPFNLSISDDVRIDEWQKEFAAYVERNDLPALEILRLGNDHTSGTKPGTLTPQAFVAQNDHALGRLVDIVSHSKYWASTAIFAIEDDSQSGPDHVDDQRTTFYLASPYAAPGVHHAHYSTSGVMRTMELLLGLPPMSIYDATAPPLYDAFAVQPVLSPFEVIPAQIDTTAQNKATAYGAAKSAAMNFTRPDAVNEAELNDILAHAVGKP